MPMHVQIIDERGDVRAEGGGDPTRLARLIPQSESRDFPVLRLIDPYGDTVSTGTRFESRCYPSGIVSASLLTGQLTRGHWKV